MTEDPKKLYGAVTANQVASQPVAHIRLLGRSREIALDLLNISGASSDDAVRAAVASFLEIESARGQSPVRAEAVGESR